MKKTKRNIGIIATIAVLGFVIWLYEEVIEEHVIPNVFPVRWGSVEPGAIYRSGQISARLVEKTLEKHGIKVVVALNGHHAESDTQIAENQAVEKLGIDFHRFALNGNGTGDIANYAHAIEVIVRAKAEKKPVLVHCSAGEMRTGGVLACYQLLVKEMPPAKIVSEMKRYGYNPRKDVALLPFINENMAELTTLLLEKQVIDAVPDPLPRF